MCISVRGKCQGLSCPFEMTGYGRSTTALKFPDTAPHTHTHTSFSRQTECACLWMPHPSPAPMSAQCECTRQCRVAWLLCSPWCWSVRLMWHADILSPPLMLCCSLPSFSLWSSAPLISLSLPSSSSLLLISFLVLSLSYPSFLWF